MATVTWVVFKHHKKVDGTYNPKIRITHNGTSSYIATPILTEMVKFKRGASSGTVTAGKLIDSLNDLVKRYREILNESPEVVADALDSKALVRFILRKEKRGQSIDFIKFAYESISSIKNSGTRTVKLTGINVLVQYLKSTTDTESLNIKLLTSNFLRKYEEWLKSNHTMIVRGKLEERKPLNDTGVKGYMSTIQSVFNKALEFYNDYELGDIVITNNPFKAYKMPTALLSDKRAVDVELIRKVASFVPSGRKSKRASFARDIYMLSFYLAGMNIADMYALNKIGDRIEYNRVKTKNRRKDDAFISVGMIPEALEIISRYRDLTGNMAFDFNKRYSLAQSMTTAVNAGLKIMCEELGIDYIQFYSARHSFATIARNDCNVSKDDIALCLNHSSGHSITDTYIKQDFSRIDGVIKKVVDFVFHPEEEGKEKAGG